MKTFTLYKGKSLNLGDEIVSLVDGLIYNFQGSYSDGLRLLVSAGTGALIEASMEDFGVSRITRPDYLIVNRRTGTLAEPGQLLPNGVRINSVSDTFARVGVGDGGHVYAGRSYQIDAVSVTDPLQEPPVVPPYKRGCEFNPPRDTGHMLLDGEWRPYREVGFLNGVYYWEKTHVEIGEELVPRSETTSVRNRSGIYKLVDTIEYNGERFLIRDCEDLAGTYYPKYMCYALVDENDDLICYFPPDADLDEYVSVPHSSYCRAFADPDSVTMTELNDYHPSNCVDWWGDGVYPTSHLYDNTFVCESCGERFDNDEYGRDGMCENCTRLRDEEEEESETDSRIRSYGNKSANSYDPEEDVPIKFGIEFEVESESRGDLLDKLDHLLPSRYAVYKEDGSISSDNGVEVVTRPDSPAVHKRIWAHALSNIPEYYFDVSNSCGIHIHVSRAPLSALHIGRMLVFVNDPENKELIKKVAGRYSSGYCVIKPNKKLSDGSKLSAHRYEALNLTSDKTIEFRLFKSATSTSVMGFLKNIEFVESLLDFTKPAVSGNRSLTTAAFKEFLTKRRKSYSHLAKFLSL